MSLIYFFISFFVFLTCFTPKYNISNCVFETKVILRFVIMNILPRNNTNSILLFTSLSKSCALFVSCAILSNEVHYNFADTWHCFPISSNCIFRNKLKFKVSFFLSLSFCFVFFLKASHNYSNSPLCNFA